MPPTIHGQRIDQETRCAHWDRPEDVVAFCFACCGDWYACRACHDDAVDHEAQTWGPGDLDQHAVYCGACSQTMTIDTYLACNHTCPSCGAPFNPGCQNHWEHYFTLDA